jgi:hypothetical protein
MKACVSRRIVGVLASFGAALAVGGLAAAPAVAADEWPALRHGMWEFSRAIEGMTPGGPPKVVETKRCINPTDEFRRQKDMLTKSGCTFTPVTRAGNVYTYSATCRMQGMAGTSRSVLTAEGDSAYSLRVDSDFGGKPTRELLKARRIGDCPR